MNPAHVDPAYAETDMFHHIIIQGMWGAGLISAVLGTKLPGPGTIYLGQDLRFRYPVSIGDTITATMTVREKKPEKGDVTLDCVCTNQNGKEVITGTAFTRAPKVKFAASGSFYPMCGLAATMLCTPFSVMRPAGWRWPRRWYFRLIPPRFRRPSMPLRRG